MLFSVALSLSDVDVIVLNDMQSVTATLSDVYDIVLNHMQSATAVLSCAESRARRAQLEH